MANGQVFQVLKTSFSVTKGEPKTYTKVSDHGNVSLKPDISGVHGLILPLDIGNYNLFLRNMWHSSVSKRRGRDEQR